MIMFNHTQRWDADRENYAGLAVLTDDDYKHAVRILHGPRKADLVVAPDGNPYLYRWYLYLREEVGFNLYFHIQIASDPARPLHDHPWDNTSHILVGGYEETVRDAVGTEEVFMRKVGDMIYRPAALAHRLVLPLGIPYTMTLFWTGPKIREWGFWYPEGWVHNSEVVRQTGDTSVHIDRRA